MDHKSCVAGASNQQLKMGVVARTAFLIDNASQWRRMRLCGPLQVKVTCSLGRIARFSLPQGFVGLPATWDDRSSSRGDAAKCEDSQHFI
jgi:hypothetical protein